MTKRFTDFSERQHANSCLTMLKTPSDYRVSLNTANDTANKCF